jgi:hypothetical protein
VTATLTRKSPKEPSIEQLAKQAARGPRFFEKSKPSDNGRPSGEASLRRLLYPIDASRLDELDKAWFHQKANDICEWDDSDRARATIIVTRHGQANGKANGHAVRGNGNAKSETKPTKLETPTAAGQLGPVIKLKSRRPGAASEESQGQRGGDRRAGGIDGRERSARADHRPQDWRDAR